MIKRLILAIVSALIASATVAYSQGALAPSGSPAPLFKTLDQVEPRTPISSIPVTITVSGSYYLTTNLTIAASDNGILIVTNDVTLDLNGFALIGIPGSGTGVGLLGASGFDNITIRNGILKNWPLNGVFATGARNGLFENLQVYGNGGNGLRVGSSSTIRLCKAYDNGGNGISANDGVVVLQSTAIMNGAQGISLGINGQVIDCSVWSNSVHGISVGDGSIVSRCLSNQNGSDGVNAADDCNIINCVASFNSGDGIQVVHNGRVTGNSCDRNGAGDGDGAGIHVTGSDNRIDSNNVTDNDRGIDVDSFVNMVIRNTARANTGGNYEIVANNRVGTIVVPPLSGLITANGPGAGSGATDPFANFAF